MRDEVGGDEVAEEVGSVSFGGLVGEDESSKGAGVEREPGLGGIFLGAWAWGAGSSSFGFGDRGEVVCESFGGRIVI